MMTPEERRADWRDLWGFIAICTVLAAISGSSLFWIVRAFYLAWPH